MYGCRGFAYTFSRRRRLDDLAGVHHVDAVGVAGDDAEVVRDDDDGRAELAAQAGHDFQHLRLNRHVERRRRLVGEQQLRVAGHGHGDHHALSHTTGELVRVVVDAALGLGDADHLEQLDGARDGGVACPA